MLLTSPLLHEEADQYVLTGPPRTVAIPDTSQVALTARRDQLTTAKEVAQLGAVLGREFPYDAAGGPLPRRPRTPCTAGSPSWWGPSWLYQRGRPPQARVYL